jgi:enoyl-CoA hydratase
MAQTHFGFETVDEKDKAKKVAGVFTSVASKYDIMNDLMSVGLHRIWKRFAVGLANVHQGQRVLDIAGGSGDLSRLFLDKPVIAAVAGYAVAGGLELACWCDLRVVEESAVFGVFCRRWGVPLIDGGTVRLPRLLGLSRALDLILTGRPVGAQEALAIGLANRVVPDGTARAAAEELAAQIAEFPQTCLRQDRRSAYEQFDYSLADALRHEFTLGSQALKSPEIAHGLSRYQRGEGRHGKFD